MPTINAYGLDIGYDVHGAGPPLVMLHGAGSAGREDWAAQIPAFSKGFHVYLPDARGHGTTRWSAKDGWSYEVLVEDLGAFVDALGLETFHLAGFSMGGLTALRYATREPARVRTLLIAGASTEREPRASLVGRLMDPERRPPTGPLSEEALARRHDAVQGAGAWRDLLPAIAADVQGQPLLTPRELRRADMPALVAVGDRDPFVPVDQAWALSRQIGDGRLLVLPDCGHELMVRRPGLFNEAAGLFYRTTEPVARQRAERHQGLGSEPMTDDALVLVDGPDEGVAVVTLNRPKALNALSPALIDALVSTLQALDGDDDVRAIVIRGSGERAFAAGADIRAMASQTAVSLTKSNAFARWDEVARIRTPLIAAVRGFALGGGCELAMACDLIVAGDDAQFGQPEIKLGVIPGVGGTQRLTRAIGKARAMELVLTGRSIDAREAERIGLVTRVVPAEETFAAAVELAKTIAAMPPLAVIAAKDAVNHAQELGLSAGLDYERRLFTTLFATADQKEGMAAFVEKRPPTWTGG